MTLENIGLVYEDKRDFEQALSYFEKAAKIYRHSLSSTHPNVIKIDQAIKRVSSKLK
jgi:tetratricopeptide (TPR) repeat protein